MATKPLETTVRFEGRTAVINLMGEIDSFGEEALMGAYAEVDRAQPEALLLDFKGVDYINSKGIALIVSVLAQSRRVGRRVLTSGLSSHYVEIFQITRLSDFMTIYPDEATALAQAAAA